MNPRIKEIESRLDSIWDRKKEIESAYHNINIRIAEIPNTIKEHIAFDIASFDNIKAPNHPLSMIVEEICSKVEDQLNTIWYPFAQAINRCNVCCPASPFEISSFSELYNNCCSKLKQLVVLSIPHNLSLHFNNQISQSAILYHIRDIISAQSVVLFKPIYYQINSLACSFYEDAINCLAEERTYFSSCLSKIKESFVSYQPNFNSIKNESASSQSTKTSTKKDSTDNKNAMGSGSIAAAAGGMLSGVACAAGALAGGIFNLIADNIWKIGKAENNPTKDDERENQQNEKKQTIDNEVKLEKADVAVYAPAEAIKGDDVLIQVYIYLPSDVPLVKTLAAQVDPDATRRNYIPLTQLLKQGDKIKIAIKSYGGDVIEEPLYETQWNRSLIKHEFIVSIPADFHKSSLLNSVNIFVNDVPVGEMKFKIRIVDSHPTTLWSEVQSKQYKKSFISYSHEDVERIRFLAEGFKIQGVDYFFDEHSLRTGDNYPKEIDQYISDCDVFVLCWSENAKKSAWVERESKLALRRYHNDDNSIRIYPISIIPKTDLPSYLSDKFHFGQIE